MRSKWKGKSRPVLVALAAVFAISVVGVSSASAVLPEFSPLTESKFTGSTGSTSLEKPGWGPAECGSAKVTGQLAELPLAKGVSHVVFKGWFCGVACWSNEAYTTAALKGRIGYLSATKKEVGLLLESEAGPWVQCLNSRKWVGSLIGKITPVNVKTTEFTVTYEAVKEGVQKLTKFEGEEATHTPEMFFESVGPFEPFALQTVMRLKTERAVELKA